VVADRNTTPVPRVRSTPGPHCSRSQRAPLQRPGGRPFRFVFPSTGVSFSPPGGFVVGGQMPIHRLLKDGDLPDDQIRVVNRAFDLAMKSLGLVDRNDPFTEMVAAKVIAAAKRGLRDPVAISQVAGSELQSSLGDMPGRSTNAGPKQSGPGVPRSPGPITSTTPWPRLSATSAIYEHSVKLCRDSSNVGKKRSTN
jgi:hypothetical protein